MFSTVQQSRQTSASGETQLPNNWMLSPDSTPPISPKSSFNDDMEDNATNPCKDRTAIADGLSPDTPPCQFGNACLIHANCMTYDPISSNDHDLKTWEVEKIKGHPSSPSSHSGVLFPSPPLVSNIGSLDFSEDTHENVKMLVTVLDLDVFQGDVKPGQDTNENVGHSVATIFSDSSEHSVEAPSPDIGANGHQPGTLCNTCSVVSPVVSSYGTGGPMQGVALLVDGGVPLNAAIENNHELVMALAHWTAEWLYSLIVQPHQRKGQPFAYRGNPAHVFTALASRISRVIRNLHNPVQVIVHALWYTIVLTRGEKFEKENWAFLKIPIFQSLHAKGTAYAEDFILQTFSVCAMIADKWVNDQSFAGNIWAQMSRMPNFIFTTLESFVLRSLNWKMHMTSVQWKDMLVMLQSPEYSRLDLSSFTRALSPQRMIVVRILDDLILLAGGTGMHAGNIGHDYEVSLCPPAGSPPRPLQIYAPQPIRPITQLFAPLEWCPEADPIVNRRPRIVGIAPGADRDASMPKSAMTAADLLESILRSPQPRTFMPFPQSAGTSFCGPFGAIGHRLTHSGSAWPTSWFSSQG